MGREERHVSSALDVTAVRVASANFDSLLQTVPQNNTRAFDRDFKLWQHAFGDRESCFDDSRAFKVSLHVPRAQGWLVSQGDGQLSEAVLQFDVLPLG